MLSGNECVSGAVWDGERPIGGGKRKELNFLVPICRNLLLGGIYICETRCR